MLKNILPATRLPQSPSTLGEGLGWGLATNAALVDRPHPPAPSPEVEGE